MTLHAAPAAPARGIARCAVAGVALAVIALSGLAVWSAVVSQNQAAGLSRVGVQTTGQLQAVQALYVIRTEIEELQDDYTDENLADLRAAQRLLPDGLRRMAAGELTDTATVAVQAQPLAARLDPAIDRFLTDPRGDILCRCEEADDTAEDAVEVLIEDLEKLLNDPKSDPARLLAARLGTVEDAGTTVRGTALVLLPLGLGSVLLCGWLLRLHQRRFAAAMAAAARNSARDARTDALTGLPNRRALMEELDRRIAAGGTFTVAMADLNGFKHYNDTFGHPEGDALLRNLGHRLGVACEPYGFAARLGGDEFCLLSDALTPEQVQTLLQEALSETGEDYSVTTVCGIATVPVEAADVTAALSLADIRLYAAKAAHYGTAGGRQPAAWYASSAVRPD